MPNFVITVDKAGNVKTYNADTKRMISSVQMSTQERAKAHVRDKVKVLREAGSKVTVRNVRMGAHEQRKEKEHDY